MKNKELLRRIDERNYLTEREHREFIERLSKDLEILEILKKHFSKAKIFAVKVINNQNEPLYILEDETTRYFFLESQEEYDLLKEWLNGKD